MLRHDPRDETSLGPGYVKSFLEDRQGRFWVGTGEGGLQRLDAEGRVLERFRPRGNDPSTLSDDYITALLEDRRGTLWVGTRSGGLNAFDPLTKRAIRYQPVPERSDSLSHHTVISIFEDSKGRLWIGTAGGGLNRVEEAPVGERARFARFTTADGLADNNVMAILEDDDGTLWLSTKRGLSRFDPATGAFSNFTVSDGLPSAEFEPGSAVRSGSTLYFGTVKWLAVISAGTRFPRSAPSPTVITSVRGAAAELKGAQPAWRLERLEVPYGEWLSLESRSSTTAPSRSTLTPTGWAGAAPSGWTWGRAARSRSRTWRQGPTRSRPRAETTRALGRDSATVDDHGRATVLDDGLVPRLRRARDRGGGDPHPPGSDGGSHETEPRPARAARAEGACARGPQPRLRPAAAPRQAPRARQGGRAKEHHPGAARRAGTDPDRRRHQPAAPQGLLGPGAERPQDHRHRGDRGQDGAADPRYLPRPASAAPGRYGARDGAARVLRDPGRAIGRGHRGPRGRARGGASSRGGDRRVPGGAGGGDERAPACGREPRRRDHRAQGQAPGNLRRGRWKGVRREE